MSFSDFFGQDNPEFDLYNDAVDEVIEQFGIPMKYVERTLIDNDGGIFGEDRQSYFKNAFDIKLYLESYTQFEGNGDMFSKFGLTVDDRATFSIQQNKFKVATGITPKVGDLLYFPFNDRLFEIIHVEDENDFFYNFGKQMIYKFNVKKFEYTGEEMDTGITEIDDVETIKTVQETYQENTNIDTDKVSIMDFSEDNPFVNIDD